MSADIVYFDLETQRTANDAGGWDRKRDMGMSVGVTYSTKLGEYRIYGERQVNALVDQLLRARRCAYVAGNEIRFAVSFFDVFDCVDDA